MVLVLETATARGVRRIGDAPPPRALQDLAVVVGHDHICPEMRVDGPVVNRHGIVDYGLNVQVRDLGPRDVHGRPNHILDQNSTVFQDGTNLWGHRVPMGQVHKALVYDARYSSVIHISQTVQLIPLNHMSVHDELNFQSRPEIRLKLLELHVHSADGLAGRPWWKCHLWLTFSWEWEGWPGQDSNFLGRSIYELN